MTLSLRDYQTECLTAIASAEARGVKRQLVTLPTGTGKTVIFANLIARRPGRALVLVHRDELARQAEEKIRLVIPDAIIGIVKAERNDVGAHIVVASIQTVSRERRLEQLAAERFQTIVVDEAHHAAADSYKKVLEAFGAEPLIVGFTATADRGDGQGLDCVFEEIVYTRNILDMIRAGYLCDLRAQQIRLEVDFNELHTRHGEFIDRECEALLLAADIKRHGVQAYRDHADGRKALVFTPTVLLAHELASAFEDADIPAAAIDGTTDIDHRRDVLAKFKTGEIRVLSNCMVLTEGFDEPSADCILMARPTKSRSLYTQIIGRGTRLHPGKEDCLVLDFVGSTTRHDLVTTPSLFGVTPKAGETVCEAIEREEAESTFGGTHANRGRMVAEAVDIFRNARLHWVRSGAAFSLSIGAGLITLTPNATGTWNATLFGNDRTRQVLARDLPLNYAQGIAEDFARRQGIKQFLDPNAAWRGRPASEKQIAALRKMRITAEPGLTAGEASDLISRRIAARCTA